jgi:type IX secretion system PorP/SprF family membrane protein
MDYRDQWVGMDGAPVTMGLSANSRILNGSMGVGAQYFSDKTGPTKRSDFALAYSYHAHFEDVELSVGAAGHMMSYLVNGTSLHMHIPYDNVIDLTTTQKKNVYDLSAGMLFYNDRFHIGISALNIAEPTVNYYPSDDTVHKTKIRMAPHMYGSVGYNWSGQADWIWENSLQVVYAEANPMVIDYNLRLHYKQKIFGGISIRLRDAIAVHAGVTFIEDFHISYSYDIVTSSLSAFQAGSHEIMLVWSSNLGANKKKKYDNNRFKRQKYSYMF